MARSVRHTLLAVAAATALSGGIATVTAPAADAATPRNGVCESGEFCLYWGWNQSGSVSDFTTSIWNYGDSDSTCYEFKGPGSGRYDCVKNNAYSFWNRTNRTVVVYYNSGYNGTVGKHTIPAGHKSNLNDAVRGQNASHKLL